MKDDIFRWFLEVPQRGEPNKIVIDQGIDLYFIRFLTGALGFGLATLVVFWLHIPWWVLLPGFVILYFVGGFAYFLDNRKGWAIPGLIEISWGFEFGLLLISLAWVLLVFTQVPELAELRIFLWGQ